MSKTKNIKRIVDASGIIIEPLKINPLPSSDLTRNEKNNIRSNKYYNSQSDRHKDKSGPSR